MPKKSNSKQKKKQSQEDELSKLLQESLKRTESEKDILPNIDISSLELEPIVNEISESRAPVLEKIADAGSQTRPIFVGAGAREENSNEGEFGYQAGRAKNAPEYSSSQPQVEQSFGAGPSLRADISQQKRVGLLDSSAAFVSNARQDDGSRWSPEQEMFSTESVGSENRRLPFESQEKKYKEFKHKRIV